MTEPAETEPPLHVLELPKLDYPCYTFQSELDGTIWPLVRCSCRGLWRWGLGTDHNAAWREFDGEPEFFGDGGPGPNGAMLPAKDGRLFYIPAAVVKAQGLRC